MGHSHSKCKCLSEDGTIKKCKYKGNCQCICEFTRDCRSLIHLCCCETTPENCIATKHICICQKPENEDDVVIVSEDCKSKHKYVRWTLYRNTIQSAQQ